VSYNSGMSNERGRRMWRWTGLTALVMLALACAPTADHDDTSRAATEQKRDAAPTIRHLTPPTDSVGALPSRFEWTPVEGADRYAIGLYNDVDRLLWRREDITTPSVARPAELELEAGTYFWRIAAIRDDKQFADSGWSAFVVRRPDR
jgi:hypothetical protein